VAVLPRVLVHRAPFGTRVEWHRGSGLLARDAAVVELDHPFRWAGQVGDDEADPRVQFALMPLDLGHDAARPAPALGLVGEAGVEHLRLLRRLQCRRQPSITILASARE
jgi:hypothetical protein